MLHLEGTKALVRLVGVGLGLSDSSKERAPRPERWLSPITTAPVGQIQMWTPRGITGHGGKVINNQVNLVLCFHVSHHLVTCQEHCIAFPAGQATPSGKLTWGAGMENGNSLNAGQFSTAERWRALRYPSGRPVAQGSTAATMARTHLSMTYRAESRNAMLQISSIFQIAINVE